MSHVLLREFGLRYGSTMSDLFYATFSRRRIDSKQNCLGMAMSEMYFPERLEVSDLRFCYHEEYGNLLFLALHAAPYAPNAIQLPSQQQRHLPTNRIRSGIVLNVRSAISNKRRDARFAVSRSPTLVAMQDNLRLPLPLLLLLLPRSGLSVHRRPLQLLMNHRCSFR